jgi:hypothetical protein
VLLEILCHEFIHHVSTFYYIDRVCLSCSVETVESFPVLEVYALIFLVMAYLFLR